MDPYNSGRAKTMIEAVAKAGPKPDRLSLKFAEGDPYLEQALKTLCKQVQAEIGLELVLEKPLAPDKLRRDVEMNHDYDLAYYHYDFASDVYWLWPLFNPESTAPGGTNYLGYHLPADLQVQFRRAMNHRHFPQIQESKQLLHRSLYQQMPLIPLWQLDRFVAYHPNLKFDPDHRFDADRNPVPIDPLLVFTEADLWQLELTAASGRN